MKLYFIRRAITLMMILSVSYHGLAQNKGFNQSFSKAPLQEKVVKNPNANTRSGLEESSANKNGENNGTTGTKGGGDLAPGSEQDNRVLFTLAGEKVYVSDFLYVYNKNSAPGEKKFTKESLDEYLKLYINFRLKVKEAEDLGMDTITSLMSELDTYRKQLSKSYLYDRDVNEHLLKEAYDRLQTEINASHILIKIDEPGLPSDTLKAYKEALNVRKKLVAGEDFATLAKKYSADESAKYNGGNIGWFTALQTVYPFENAAYTLKRKEISMPVRTRFGYHIVRVDDTRDAQGEMTVAHIMLKLPSNPDEATVKQVLEQANKIYEEAKNGGDWDELVKKYTEDKTTRNKAGELPAFTTGRMVEQFEAAAFGLKKDGEISKPVQTEYGIHIIKRLSKKPTPTFEESKSELKKRVERDSRSEIAKNALLDKIKKEYGFKEYSKNSTALYNKIGEQLPSGKLDVEGKDKLTLPLFTLAEKTYTQADFVTFLEESAKKKRADPAEKIYGEYYEKFLENSLLAYEESQLERKHPEFRMLMKEYRDGILLFELTNEKVWNKAIKDTTGLKEYYETIKTKYMWPERVYADIYTITDPSIATKARKLLTKKGKDAMLAKYNKGDAKVITVKNGIYSKNDNDMVDNSWQLGQGPVVEDGGKVQFVNVTEIIPPTPKSLNEAKGFIVSDYQEYLENQWIKELRNKYKVEVNQEVLNSLIK